MLEANLNRLRLEHVAKAIFRAEYVEPFPSDERSIGYAIEMQKAIAATQALAEAMELWPPNGHAPRDNAA